MNTSSSRLIAVCAVGAIYITCRPRNGDKPWAQLTRDDIQRVYDELEDGVIKNSVGLPYQDRQSYYNKVLKSKPFRLARRRSAQSYEYPSK